MSVFILSKEEREKNCSSSNSYLRLASKLSLSTLNPIKTHLTLKQKYTWLPHGWEMCLDCVCDVNHSLSLQFLFKVSWGDIFGSASMLSAVFLQLVANFCFVLSGAYGGSVLYVYRSFCFENILHLLQMTWVSILVRCRWFALLPHCVSFCLSLCHPPLIDWRPAPCLHPVSAGLPSRPGMDQQYSHWVDGVQSEYKVR